MSESSRTSALLGLIEAAGVAAAATTSTLRHASPSVRSAALATSMRGAELRLAEIERLRQEIAALQAQLAREVTAYVDQRLAADAELGVPDGPSTRCMAAEVALAEGVSVIAAQSLMSDCWDLVTNNPPPSPRCRPGTCTGAWPGGSSPRPA